MRIFLKALTYRICGTLFTGCAAYYCTGSFKVSSSVAGIEFIGKLLLYYLHEKVWNLYKNKGV